MPVKILSVDDSRMVRLLVARAFKSFDCQIFEAENGQDGIAVATREKPDVIILDFTMPIMDGMEMFTALKGQEELKSIPVVMLTAERSPDLMNQFAKLGVRDYLVKPFKEQEIIDRVGRVVPLKSVAAA